MTGTTDANKRFGFLARLRKDEAGNTLALFAAAIFPMIGLVGGAIDISRVYAVKTRMQAACDAGSLAARKVMGNGTWTASSDTAGNRMFLSNFEPGFLGSDGIDVDFDEANGTVSGTAETTVPMALMQVLGIDDEEVRVTCTSEMKIPNTDVMFVLDVTGSMDEVIPGDPSGKKKMAGLKESVKCFYEALARENIASVSFTTCKKAADPIGDLSELTQLRFGFVPFSSQVNVGRLLPNGYMKDTQSFQSRFPNLQTVQTWQYGTESGISWPGNWTPSAIPTNPYHTRQSTSSWINVTVDTTTAPGGFKTVLRTGTNADTESECEGSNHNNLASSSSQLTGLTQSFGTPTGGTYQSATNNPPTHPNTQQTVTYNRTRSDTITQYRYNWEDRGSGNKCYLERRDHTTLMVRADNGGTSTRQIDWTERQRITNWTYRSVPFNVAPLKAGGGNDASLNYNSSLPLPINQTSGSYNLSGSATSTTLYFPANRNVSWNGCIEERQTVKNIDGNPFDEWGSVPTTPIAAWDMTVDMAPVTSDEQTRWGFMLGDAAGSGTGAVWPRATGVTFNGSGNVTGYTRQFGDYNRTPDQAEVTDPRYQFSADNCPKEASRYRAYREATGAGQFETYVNALAPVGGTYQDLGLIWGARLMSPTGIFGSSNATTPTGLPIQRHMIFMTDGVTDTSELSYTPYGLEYWDRRRTGDGLTPTETWLDDITKARIENLCTQIKNLGETGVTVWVIYYGEQTLPANAPQVDKDRLANTITRMKTCATQPSEKFFFPASSTSTLMDAFNKIADSISELKLTS